MNSGSGGDNGNGTRGNADIVVILGGPSAEHDVSAVSGWAIADALVESGHNVDRLFLDLDRGWWWMPASASSGRPKPGAFDDPAAKGAAGPMTPAAAIEQLAARDPRPVVFPALHGTFGEDGTLQALLEAYDLAYTGAGVTASSVGMDKALFKRLARGLGLSVVDWMEVTASRWAADRSQVLFEIQAWTEHIGSSRLMVKPSRLGSSVGMTIAHSAGERGAALDTAFRFDTVAIVERYLNHPRELEVAVIGNDAGDVECFGPGEVFPGREFYDYVAKYTDGVSDTILTARLTPEKAAEVRAMAEAAYLAVGCEGLARIDFLLDESQLYLSEINTMPGFTPISLFPQLAAAGLGSFGAVCERIVELGERRHAARIRRHLTTADLPR